MLEKIFKLSERVCLYGVVFQGILLLGMAFYICVDVLLRKLFSYSIKGSIELSSYVLAAMSGWIFSYALLNKAHVRIDIFYIRLPLKIKVFLDVVSYISLLLFFIPLTYYSYRFFYTSLMRHSVANTPLHTPLWLPESVWVAGLVFFIWVIILSLLRVMFYLIKGDYKKAYSQSGISTLEEEIEQERNN